VGTRADYYVGTGIEAEWIGSVAWDGDEVEPPVKKAKTEQSYRKAVKTFLESRDDASFPKDGWPWPWDDSGTSDCAFTFSNGKFKKFKGPYPDMSAKKNVTFGKRSGLIVFGG
jgi:hypothetical protein